MTLFGFSVYSQRTNEAPSNAMTISSTTRVRARIHTTFMQAINTWFNNRQPTDSVRIQCSLLISTCFFFAFLPIIIKSIIFPTRLRSYHFYPLFRSASASFLQLDLSFCAVSSLCIKALLDHRPRPMRLHNKCIISAVRLKYSIRLSSFSPSSLIHFFAFDRFITYFVSRLDAALRLWRDWSHSQRHFVWLVNDLHEK